MSLGLCCQWLEKVKGKDKNVLVSRSLQLGRFKKNEYSRDRISSTYLNNLDNLLQMLPVITASGISVFRMSSSMFPLFDLVDQDLWDNAKIRHTLRLIGNYVKDNSVRLTTHPGQFVSLSSDRDDVVEKSVRELDFHSWLMDQMGLEQSPYYSINVHGGKGGRPEALIASINKLRPSTKNRLTLENCEYAYSVSDLLPVCEATNVPICFDSHHHMFNNGHLSTNDALELSASTWPKGAKPLTHLSNSPPDILKDAPTTKLRKHSDYIRYIPELQLELNNKDVIDIDIEAKKKNFAIFDANKLLNIKL